MLEIDDDVRVAVARGAIANVVPPEELQRLEADEVGEADQDDGAEEGVTADEPLTAEERASTR
jgi:hypothetical protein